MFLKKSHNNHTNLHKCHQHHSSQIIRLLARELDLDRAHVLTNGPHVLADTSPAGVDFLRVNPVLGVQSQALFLPGQLQQIRALAHDGGAAGRHLEHLLLRGLPRDDIELLDLGLAEEPAGAAAEDRRRGIRVELRRGESCGSLRLLRRRRGLVGHGADWAVGGGGDGLCRRPEGGELREGLLPRGRQAVGGVGGGECGGEEGGLGSHGHEIGAQPSTPRIIRRVRVQQGIRNLNRPTPIPEPSVKVPLHNPLLNLHQSLTKPPESLEWPTIRRPFRTLPLPEINLVSRVPRQYFNKRHSKQSLKLCCYRFQKSRIRARLQLSKLGSPGLGH
ncbi:photosystem I subunit II [Striga asiatica]|uniref:Photosystem I subunit II n=1 Tax=Striga asiatica TaxID=4170 RepID=A0A5A7QID0_STRAF|nr:photosystem I subunit II [Striga asiatica]